MIALLFWIALPLTVLTVFQIPLLRRQISLGSYYILEKIRPRFLKRWNWQQWILLLLRTTAVFLILLWQFSPRSVITEKRTVMIQPPRANQMVASAAGRVPEKKIFLPAIWSSQRILDSYSDGYLILQAMQKVLVNPYKQIILSMGELDLQSIPADSLAVLIPEFSAMNQFRKSCSSISRMLICQPIEKIQDMDAQKSEIRMVVPVQFQNGDTSPIVLKSRDGRALTLRYHLEKEKKEVLIFLTGLDLQWGDFALTGEMLRFLQSWIQPTAQFNKGVELQDYKPQETQGDIKKISARLILLWLLLTLIVESLFFLISKKNQSSGL